VVDVKDFKSNVIRVSEDILSKLREIMPELKDESDANIVRIALRKFIYQQSLPLNVDIEKEVLKILKQYPSVQDYLEEKKK
jgi:antitoxin component of RelBE/YafQ-DinJ toxin-antitoxin module